jgi:phage terminase small subunit
MPDLTDQQKLFCQEYIVDLNATQAAIRAKYSEDSASQQGSRLLSIDKVQDYVSKLQDERSNRVSVTADDVLKDLLYLKDVCLGKEEITVTDSDGSLTTTKVFKEAGANKALESLGKHLKMFTDRVEQTTDLTLTISDEELDAELDKLSED